MAVTDSLTKLYIRRHFVQRLEDELRRARRYNHNLSLLVIDIDHFKTLNDKYGHQAGDAVLVEMARAFRRMTRATDVTARYGGEEFCIILPETPLEGAQIIAERLRVEIENVDISFTNYKLKTTISIGVATFPIHAENVEGLIRAADLAMYKAKELGRNRTVVCNGMVKIESEHLPEEFFHSLDVSE
jgi:diguanylate cyclase (GGDEF)-like protein